MSKRQRQVARKTAYKMVRGEDGRFLFLGPGSFEPDHDIRKPNWVKFWLWAVIGSMTITLVWSIGMFMGLFRS